MQKGRMLIVDDEETLREAFARFLSSKGYEVDQAENGEAALAELRKRPYDLLITDMMMPEMSGEELLDSLDEFEPDARPDVIVMTAFGTVESAIKGIKAGVSAYIRKPLNMNELETAVNSAIDRRRMAREIKQYYEELDRKVEERTRELALLSSFTSLVNRSFDLDAILDDAVRSIAGFMEADVAGIYLLEGVPPMLHLKAHTGISDEFRKAVEVIDLDETYKGAAMKDAPVIIDDQACVQDPIRGAIVREGLSTGMSVPIRTGDNLLGIIRVASRTGKDFHGTNLQILNSFGNQIGVAIDRSSLFNREKAAAEDLMKKVNQLVILSEMGHLARASNGLDEAAMVVVSAIVQGIGFDRVCMWLLDADGRTLRIKACHGLDLNRENSRTAIDMDDLAYLPLEDGEAFLASGSACDMELMPGGPPTQAGMIVLAPLVTRNPDNKELHCWEHLNCNETDCKAYNNTAIACWMIKDSCAKHPEARTLLDKMEFCRNCDIYKANRRGKNIGFLCADNRPSGRPIDSEDVKLLNVFANKAAILVENINLVERLSKNEQFIDSIILNMSSGLLVLDLDNKVRMLNYLGAQILRCSIEDVMGRDITEFYPETRKFIEVREDHSLGHEITLTTKDGSVPIGYSNSYLVEGGKAADSVIVVFRDLSEIKKLQGQLREEDHFAAIGKVAAGVAHEIRNPLFGITSVAQILSREMKDDSPTKALIVAMLSETTRLNTLVEDMLLYGRAVKVSPQPLNINGLIESVLDFNMANITQKDLHVIKDFDPDLPPVMLDPNQMRQVFLNVLVNALDASSKGGEIMLKTRKLKDKALVKFCDNGTGIPEADLPKVFDLFYTTKEKGTGLGLAICRKIVEDHGGAVSIASKQGVGTTITLTLPRPSE